MLLKSTLICVLLSFIGCQLFAQASGDAGIGTIGNFDALKHDSASPKKYEVDLLYTYGSADGGVNYSQPQINLRRFNKNGSFFELRLPYSIINKNDTSTSGMGDILFSYSNSLSIKGKKVKFSLGTRISFSNAFLGNTITVNSYPMSVQPGLGTIDLLAAANYDFCQYLSVAAGVQVPIIQYDKNIGVGLNPDGIPGGFNVNNFRRQPDAMLKLTGHFGPGKLKFNPGLTSIFHLSDDYYSSYSGTTSLVGNYYLENSYGIYLNVNASLSYIVNKRVNLGIFYSQSLVSPDNNAAGLARNWIISPKVTYAF